ncbi:MAG: hydroxyacid dehydrogenase [Anaerolineae bacterium]|nr:hydroxyacid dehydrogenase [Anaerolineae bacterium]MCI0607893.1 hydroxyacid dehydrogenase [Anaerolineae bacterium]
MPEFNILITDGLDESGQSILRASAKVDDQSEISADDLLTAIHNYDALIVRGRTKVTASVMDAASRLKVIGRAGVGVDNIDLEAAKKHKITVVNAPMSTSLAVAELTFGLMLALAREIPRADAGMKQGGWLKKELEGVELNGKTLGLIGFGRIGVEVGKRASAFGMNIIAYDPLILEDDIKQRGAEPVSIQDLYAWSDFISLHLPLNVQTRDMMGPLAFSQMKDGVRIVCAARGGIIDESALVAALNSGKVAGAALDVFGREPPGLTETVSHPRVIATPHIGAQTVEAQSRASEDIANEVLSALQEKPLRWKVN